MLTSLSDVDVVNDAVAAWERIHYNALDFQVVIALNYANTVTWLTRKMNADVFPFLSIPLICFYEQEIALTNTKHTVEISGRGLCLKKKSHLFGFV